MVKAPTAKRDLYKEHRSEYVEIGPAMYLAVAGQGEPGGAASNEAFAALYPVAYTIKFLKKAEGRDFKVTGLEGQWWVEGRAFASAPPSEWSWRLLLRVPDFVTERDLERAAGQLEQKGKWGPFVKSD